MKVQMESIIAKRNITAAHPDNRESVVTVKLGSPNYSSHSPDVSIPYVVHFEDKTRTHHAVGIDGFQAIQLAMKMIEVDLDALEREYGLRMHENNDISLGFRYF